MTNRLVSTSPDIVGIVNELVNKQLKTTSNNNFNSNINTNQLEKDVINTVYSSFEGIFSPVILYFINLYE